MICSYQDVRHLLHVSTTTPSIKEPKLAPTVSHPHHRYLQSHRGSPIDFQDTHYHSMITENQITIGVELEMLISPKTIPQTTLSEKEAFKLVAKALIPVAGRLGTYVIDTGSTNGVTDCSHAKLMAAFHIQKDDSITSKYPQNGLERGVEVATPILRNGQWEIAIPKMCQALRKNLALGFNESTGLHVHIGIGRDYRLQDLKRISKAVTLFERHMDTYHSTCRFVEPVLINDWDFNYIQSNRYNKVFKDLSDLECIKVIDQVPDIPQLLWKINCHSRYYSPRKADKWYKYNLTSVEKYGTIEFRQAIATDNEDDIVDWIDTAIRFVTSAISTPDDMFDTWARDGVNDPAVYEWFGVPTPTATF